MENGLRLIAVRRRTGNTALLLSEGQPQNGMGARKSPEVAVVGAARAPQAIPGPERSGAGSQGRS